MKKKVWSILLTAAVLLSVADLPLEAGAAGNPGASGSGVQISVKQNDNEKTEQGTVRTAHVSAINSGTEDSVLRVYLQTEDGTSPDTDVEVINLYSDEGEFTGASDIEESTLKDTLKEALTLSDGNAAALEAEWKQTKDRSGTVTERFLEAALPAGAAASFDMQLMYRTDEENYTKTTLVKAKAFVDDQDVTQASEDEDEDSEAEFVWEAEADAAESEAGQRIADSSRAASSSALGISAQTENSNKLTVYYVPSDDWQNLIEQNGYALRGNMSSGTSGTIVWDLVVMQDTGRTVNGRPVYQADFDRSKIQHGGAGAFQVWLCTNESAEHDKGLIAIFSSWTEESVFSGRVYIDGGWNDYTPDIISAAGTELTFYDMTGALEGNITAQFSTNQNLSNAVSAPVTDGKVTVPDDQGDEVYRYIRFMNGDSDLTEVYDLLGNVNVTGGNTTFYYGRTSLQNGGIISAWGTPVSGKESLAGKTLYFGSDTFNINSEIQIDDGESVVVDHPSNVNNMLCYTFEEDSSATQQSLISVTTNNNTYRFFWADTAYNEVTITYNLADVNESYAAAKRIYYDATLSKLSYKGTDGAVNDGKGIPYDDNSGVYIYATGDNLPEISAGKMTRDGDSDQYYYDLPAGYTRVRFASYGVTNENAPQYGDATIMTEIPMGYTNPCFYGDTSDDVIYNQNTNRGGYWDELGSVRDAENGKDTDVVDIDQESFVEAPDTMYVNSTFYDYYTDYELNGNNRDNYGGANAVSQRYWVTFRQFDQALSDYYRENGVQIPIYTGHFQPNWSDWGTLFSAISDTLNLYGYNGVSSQSGFMSTNNSTMDIYGSGGKYDFATQGLVANTLSGGNLTVKDGSAAEPHFDEDFINGNNSKNAKLGDVYNNVSFPFTKKDIDNNGVEYWYFDSADTTLAMKQDPSTGEYYLQDVGHQDWAKNVNSSSSTSGVSTTYGFFPFNETSAAASAKNYNYGFGTKIEFTFRLTEDGNVLDKNGNPVPITFEFSGDDDVWVFIDGNLALDVGGSHGRVTGEINFSGESSTKSATVSNVKAGQGANTSGSNVESSFEIEGENGDVHTLTMFYMERGMWESNMRISFNFPDENEFAIEKQVDDSDVNQDLFAGLFDDASVFPFTIQNQATHYGKKDVDSSEAASPETFNDTFNDDEVSSSWSTNVFEPVESYDGRDKVVHWYAHDNDVGGNWKDRRFGVIEPGGEGTFDASDTKAYLQFKFYYQYNDTPGLAYIYLELEDTSGNKIGGYLSGKVYGNSSLRQNTWNTIQVDLSKMDGYDNFDFSQVKNIKFNYDYPRDIYLDDFTFIPSVVAQGKTGFITAQHEIPDYGSAESGKLEYPEGAQYTLEKASGATQEYRIGSDGMFALADGETATFKDQFRRGSYISVTEDINTDVFETTWTLYENGSPVRSMNDGSSINIVDPVSVNGVSGTVLKDGRQEEYRSGRDDQDQEISNSGYTQTGWAKDSSGQSNSNTIVFRSYSRPDDETVLTKLKAVFVNKVKTGSIVIKKDKTEDSSDLEGSYTFRVTFSNVAGMSLEQSSISREYTIKYGESVEIDGIPAGTSYTIEEIRADDGATLEDVVTDGTNASFDPVSKTVTGTVTANESAELVFKNTLKPTVNINLEKIWEGTGEGIDIPDSIKIQLQRSSDNGGTWKAVRYGDTDYIELRMNYEGEWKYAFEDLDQYVDYKANPQVPWLYRVVELGEDNKPIESGGYLGDYFKVTYSDNLKFEGENPADGNFTITNTYSPKTGLKITKVDASDTNKKLGGVEFTLEKGTIENNTFTPDSSFGSKTLITGTEGNDLGIATIDDLSDGTYRLTETKSHEGYSLLKSPLILVIDRTGQCTVRSEDQSEDQAEIISVVNNVISLTISNRLLFELPSTGGYLRAYMIAGGLALAGLALFIYRLQKRRKGARAPRK